MKLFMPIAALFLTLPSFAGIIFSDNFESNGTALNTTPTGWTVTNGAVDIVGPSFFNGLCATGTTCIDMDGK
jgi:hypothetical protein